MKAFMKSSSKSLHVFFNPIDIVASMNTNSSTTVPSKYNCETDRKSCLKAFRRSILDIKLVLKQGMMDSLNPMKLVV